MVLSEDIRSITEFRANATAFIDQVNKTGRPIVLTKNGKSSAVIVDVEEYDEMKSDHSELLRIKEEMEIIKDIMIGMEDLKAGRVHSTKEAKRLVLSQLMGGQE